METLLRCLSSSRVLFQRSLSEHRAARAALPNVQSDLELLNWQLSIGRSSQVQTWLQPPSESTSSSSLLKSEDNSLSLVNKPDDSDTFTDAHLPAAVSSPSNKPAKRRTLDNGGVLCKPVSPEPPPKFIDPLLQRIDTRSWTNVSVTNEFATSAISLYLETDYTVLGLFGSKLFLSSGDVQY
ncbi:hypothetical protein DL98DRAFT_609378 [Cadophora sp. DSE1049]|nr:hypothetical protein DL98DRAFT_609378 [Cadophora sp. DSE1049]